MIRRHTDLCIRHKGESVAIREMRKHVGWYLKGFKNAAAVRKRVNGAKTREQLFCLLKDYEKELEGHR